MIKKSKKVEFPSELRMDMVGGDWVVIATGRARRPETFKQEKRAVKKVSKKDCPFCNLSKQEKPTLIFNKGRRVTDGVWTTVVVPNKYPAFFPYSELNERTEGKLHKKMNAVGFHEVVITFDHQRQLAQFSIE